MRPVPSPEPLVMARLMRLKAAHGTPLPPTCRTWTAPHASESESEPALAVEPALPLGPWAPGARPRSRIWSRLFGEAEPFDLPEIDDHEPPLADDRAHHMPQHQMPPPHLPRLRKAAGRPGTWPTKSFLPRAWRSTGTDELPADFFAEIEVEPAASSDSTSSPRASSPPADTTSLPREISGQAPAEHGASALEHEIPQVEHEAPSPGLVSAVEAPAQPAPRISAEQSPSQPTDVGLAAPIELAAHQQLAALPVEETIQPTVEAPPVESRVDVFATAAITEANAAEDAVHEPVVPAEDRETVDAAQSQPESAAGNAPQDSSAFAEVMSPEINLPESIFDVEFPTGPGLELNEHAPLSGEPAESGAGQDSGDDLNVLEGEILEAEIIEPEFGESRPYQPQFLDCACRRAFVRRRGRAPAPAAEPEHLASRRLPRWLRLRRIRRAGRRKAW